jgi:hypothetical protein
MMFWRRGFGWNAMKALVISDARGRVLFGGANCRGSTADITQARQAGVADWLEHTFGVEILTDAGYQGLGAHTVGQVVTPTLKHQKKRLERMPGIAELRDAQRKSHARRRVRVEHTIAHMKNWRSLTRHLGAATHLTTPSAPSPGCCLIPNTPSRLAPSIATLPPGMTI